MIMVFDWFKKLGRSQKRPRNVSDRNAVIRRVVAAAADESKRREAARTVDADGPRTPTPGMPASTPAGENPTKDRTTGIPRDQIARRAYEIWLRKGRPFGTADQDWLEAERELLAEVEARSDPEPPSVPNP
jgi:hypothetical protein